jgi:predicted acyl esterase
MKADYAEVKAESEVTYKPMEDIITFTHTFAEDTEITGYMKLHLNVECKGYNDMDMFVWVKKNGLDGKHLPVWAMHEPYRGVWGYMRASHRELDPDLATDFQPVQSHKNLQKLNPGQVVSLDVEMYPHSRFWHKGETLVIEIAGRFVKSDWFEDDKVNIKSDNGDGIHVLHTGGKYESYLQIPVVPPKYVVGDYVYKG